MSRPSFGSNAYLTSDTYDWKMDAAAEMRQNMTPSEAVVWAARRAVMGDAGNMVRQKLIRGYIVDFYLPTQRAIIEVDGKVHESDRQSRYDERRDDVFLHSSYSILRIEAAALMRYPDASVDAARDFVLDGEDEYGSRRTRWGWVRLARQGVRSKLSHKSPIDHYPDGLTDLWHQEPDCDDQECGGRRGEASIWPLVVGA